MFRRLHIQLTFFCTLVTGIILIGLTIACLQISETGLRQNSELAFQTQRASIVSYLENQGQISYEWIAKTQNNKQLILDIEDNGIPILFSELSQSEEEAELVSRAREIALSEYNLDLSNDVHTSIITQHVEFKLTGKQSQDYKVSAMIIPKSNGYLSVVLLYSLHGLKNQIFRQRIMFLVLDIIALLLLTFFSWIFTKKMLEPIETSRIKQVQFVATASHELRTPLMVILSSLSAMKKADAIQAEKFANTIEREGQRMTRLVNDMLTLARADNSVWSPEIQNTELDTLLLGVYEKFESIAEEKEISFSIELPNELMNEYSCDVMRMEQVFTILIDNAINYTPVGGKIKLTLFATHNRLEVRIIDNGPGIPDEEKENIFERFYRAEKSHSQKDHFGLGLCIAKEIVKLHKGKLYVTDTPGGGATFVISLPRFTG